MNYSSLLLGILPLLAFVIIDSVLNQKAALISAIILAVLEAIVSYILFHEIDLVTIFSLTLVILLAVTAYKQNSSFLFKMQPVILSLFLGAALVISYAYNKPILYMMMLKYQNQMPVQIKEQITHPYFIALFRLSTFTLGIALFVHALVTYIAAIKLSNWWWIALRGIGFYVLCFIAMMVANIIVSRSVPLPIINQ